MMCFVSCVCLDESLYVGTCVFVSSVLGSLLMYGFCLMCELDIWLIFYKHILYIKIAERKCE